MKRSSLSHSGAPPQQPLGRTHPLRVMIHWPAEGNLESAREIRCGDQGSLEGLADMADSDVDKLGPVDYLVLEFPADRANFTGEIAEELTKLVDAGTIRVIDMIILTKDDAGNVDAMELSDLGDLGALVELEAQLADLLAAEDVERLANAMEPGSIAGALVYENLWAAPFASSARRAGGQLVASGRIPIQAIVASLEADEARETTGA